MQATKACLFLILGLIFGAPAAAEPQEVDPDSLRPSHQHQQVAVIVKGVVEKYHYKKQALDDAWSERILERYLESLDANRSFFLQSDIDNFNLYRHRLDDSLRTAALEPAFNIFRVYRHRVDERVAYAKKLLEREFDFSRDEYYQFDREGAPWAASPAELDESWRRRVKNDVLALRMADKSEAEIRETLEKRYDGIARRVSQLTADDVFQTFINSYTLTLEPHTSYMSPSVSENFDISMRLSLEGIGAVLRSENEFTEIQSVVSGGPAKRSGQLRAGDRIVAVAQGEDGEMVDVVGWRLQEVVKLIRGPKGSTVRLQVLPKDEVINGKPKEVALVRDKIKLEDQAAKSRVIEGLEGMDNVKIGVIEVPAFYRDFQGESRGDKDFRSTTRDVRALLGELQAQAVDGVVVDLRDNGGGSLSEATELTGLFIESGPVVQVKDAYGDVEVERDPDKSIAYAGPLLVLVNRNSASASEIFAGAIQDYKRGIVVGEPTFGKGTVQTLVDLDRFVRGQDVDLGRLRLTMAQFFRINGGSTQHRGVVPDILFPTASGAADHGERALDNALPWASIEPARYSPRGIGEVAYLRDRHQARIAKDAGFQLLSSQEAMLKEIRDTQELSLVEAQRKQELDNRERASLESKNRFRVASGLDPIDMNADDEGEEDEAEAEAIKRIQVDEAARILADQILASRPLTAMH
jgi:carboxyl-terminal processing protease